MSTKRDARGGSAGHALTVSIGLLRSATRVNARLAMVNAVGRCVLWPR